ncbi:MAG: hypothetical protein A3C55_00565 [Gammaproteobacteria bacterium RIFCSPHIGHO2_02_FULL_42_13]|nr:MAG: hypothetical protein A3C55_00565 [Gammaproteobacteria bacterium RIFCSPHIGHO2_02_FULL_42_13]
MAIQTDIQSADVVCDKQGRRYHIDLAPGELAEYIVLVGEAKRAERAAKLLTDIRIERYNREYHTFTGRYKGLEISIMSTGMGPGCTEIGVIEIFQITKNPTLLRVGTCGSLQPKMEVGDLIISTGAVRLEDTSTYFVHEGYPAIANHEAVLALTMAADKLDIKYHLGITATGSGFYGAQGRDIPGIHIRYPNLPDELAKMNVANFEMEASTLFTLCAMKGCRASAICTAVANRYKKTFISNEQKSAKEKIALTAGLDALLILAKMDKAKTAKNKKYWIPDL